MTATVGTYMLAWVQTENARARAAEMHDQELDARHRFLEAEQKVARLYTELSDQDKETVNQLIQKIYNARGGPG